MVCRRLRRGRIFAAGRAAGKQRIDCCTTSTISVILLLAEYSKQSYSAARTARSTTRYDGMIVIAVRNLKPTIPALLSAQHARADKITIKQIQDAKVKSEHNITNQTHNTSGFLHTSEPGSIPAGGSPPLAKGSASWMDALFLGKRDPTKRGLHICPIGFYAGNSVVSTPTSPRSSAWTSATGRDALVDDLDSLHRFDPPR